MSTHIQVFVLTYICNLFLKTAVPLYIPIGNVWGFQFLHILSNIKKKIFVINHLVFEYRTKAG